VPKARNVIVPRAVDAGVTTRTVDRRVVPIHTYEGAGFGVYRPFPQTELELLDPFLLLDEMEPRTVAPGEAKGAPDHPHRGFETVTYVLEGEVEHRDSQGNRGHIGPGDVQWMTAGAGLVHSEMPSTALQTNGGELHGFQLWVNLPAADKMIRPRYQAISADQIPVVDGDGWRARVIAGSFAGVDGAAKTHTPVTYAHVTVEPGRTATFDLPPEFNVGTYVFSGGPRELRTWRRGAGGIELVAGDEPLDVLVMAGRPLDEPVARYGPFVMNTRQQLIDAADDFNAGRMGSIAPEQG
jgi:redox-sensitive bicupin YhaK (pirin superfamily)